MGNPTTENLPTDSQETNTPTAENKIDKQNILHEIGIGVLGNAVWTLTVWGLGRFVGAWKDVMPPSWMFIIIAAGSLLISLFLRHFFKNLTDYYSYAHYLRYIMITGSVIIGLALFIMHCQTLYDLKQEKDIAINLRILVSLAIILSILIVNTMYVNHKYRNIRRNKQQIDIREENRLAVDRLSEEDIKAIQEQGNSIMAALDRRSKEFEDALTKKDNDTAITATIIPFKTENNYLYTYLMDNVASYKSFSWMFAGGHVKFAENEAPDAIAVSRAKTELGLKVKILNAPVVQDEMVDNMMVIVRPNYVYRFFNSDAKCYLEHGHEYHLDLVYLGEIETTLDGNILHKCIEIKIPFDKKYDKGFVVSKCNEAKNFFYRCSRVKQKDQRNIPDYIFNMLYAAYSDYYDHIKGRTP